VLNSTLYVASGLHLKNSSALLLLASSLSDKVKQAIVPVYTAQSL